MESKYDHPSYRENAAAPPAIVKQDKVVTTQMRFISEAWKSQEKIFSILDSSHDGVNVTKCTKLNAFMLSFYIFRLK